MRDTDADQQRAAGGVTDRHSAALASAKLRLAENFRFRSDLTEKTGSSVENKRVIVSYPVRSDRTLDPRPLSGIAGIATTLTSPPFQAHSETGDGLMPFSRPLVSERGDRDPLHGGATDKEEVHRTSPLQGRLPASSADRLQTLTRRKTQDLAPRFMHRCLSGLQAWR